jgi:NAD(P)-dependent dehydrogenase (short-subunit alcohol dehydrogenase family)
LHTLSHQNIAVDVVSSYSHKANVSYRSGYGANVAFGDWNVDFGQKLAKELGEGALFRHCDVSKWDDVLMLFQMAWKAFGTIHVVIGNAGITRESFIEDTYDQETGKLEAPDLESG